ncbi:MAG: ribonuclease HII [Alphaproteobacteria bacterium]
MPRAKPGPDLFDPPIGARIAGIDEAGRGPLAGPVVAAAVIIDPARVPEGVTDSKLIAEPVREELYGAIIASAEAWGVGAASVREIDRINIHHASLLAMKRAFAALKAETTADFAYVDGIHLPRIKCMARAVIDGDALIPQVSAASIIAKVTRDRMMRALHEKFPGYGWASNKGYSTREHLLALQSLGATRHHRRSFEPVRIVLSGGTIDGLVTQAAE